MRHILHIFFCFLGLCVTYSCSGGHEGAAEALEGKEIPSMITYDVSMLISDSGVIKYRALTPTWIRYDEESKEAYQYFPDGIEFEKIDTTFSTTEKIIADTAYNWENQQLWHLIKNVEVTSVKGERFVTNDLYWDMRRHEVYSDSFIHIERADNIIEGYGFKSTDDFSSYTIRETNGMFNAKEEEDSPRLHPSAKASSSR